MEANHPWESAPAVMRDYRDRQRNYWEKCELIDKSAWIPCPNCKQRIKNKGVRRHRVVEFSVVLPKV